MNNSEWSHCIIDQLIQQGIRNFCIAPGSRSTPLALAAVRHPKALTTVHYDERGLGFYALGLSPAAIIVTSGTAVGNLMPSVMEAHYSYVPMIFLTADRPPELRDCSANQSADQIKIFQNYTRWQCDLPCPDSFLEEDYIRSQAVQAVFQAIRHKGPVHLNCQFREPLFIPPHPQKEGSTQPLFYPKLLPDSFTIKQCETLLNSARQGVIVLGRMPINSNLAPLFELAKSLSWPIFSDLLSQARCNEAPFELIRHFDYAIRTKPHTQPDFIIHFGDRITSKFLLQWMKDQKAPILHVSSLGERVDPLHARPNRIWADPDLFCQSLSIQTRAASSWLEEWKSIDESIEETLQDCFETPHSFTEADMMRAIGKELPEDWALFLANSMPIRDAEHFLFPKKAKAFFANRGLSGIDGQIATAAGIAKKLKCPMAAIIGDQSALHDLNSIALLHQLKTPFLLIISNNFGGGIFSYLPAANEPEHFEKLLGASHSYQFKKIAEMFRLPYRTNLDFNIEEPTIVEIVTSRSENTSFQKMILEKCNSKTKEAPFVR